MNSRLIINADDYSLTAGCDRAIAECVQAGAVTSASCVIYPRFDDPPPLPASVAGRCGVHLRLTDGYPLCAKVPSLVGDNDRFPDSREAVATSDPPDPKEVLMEWRAQIDQFIHWWGTPTHLDSHHHVHGLMSLRSLYARLCVRYNVAGVPLSDSQRDGLRALGVKCADRAITWATGSRPALEGLLKAAFANYRTIHLATHPGYLDDDLRRRSGMTHVREREREVLMDPTFKIWLRAEGIELIGYADL